MPGGVFCRIVEQTQAIQTFADPFANVQTLIERSQPKPRLPWFWYLLGTLLLLTMVAAYFGDSHPQAQIAIQVITSVLMFGLIGTMVLMSWHVAQQHRNEQQKLQAVEEMIQLRRWPQAAALLHELLGAPMRTQAGRIQALIFLGSVLARYHRFEDAIVVHNYLLEHVQLDPVTEHGLRLARTMAMLREDHLFDADREIAELRRTDRERESGWLALVEMYRDVKTGHPDEVIKIFQERLGRMRQQLGHRLGEAYALVARAYDLLGQEQPARDAYSRATLLCPPAELHRRYPETQPLAQKYPASPAPAGWLA